jgi:Potassium-transporting ATPase A subunit
MEGKEVRFGIGGSPLTAVVTSNTGSNNSMDDSYTSLGDMVLLVNMLLGELVFGGATSTKRRVSADTILTDDDLRRALGGDGDVRVMHVFVAEDDSSADHVWILSIQEKDNLSKYLSSKAGQSLPYWARYKPPLNSGTFGRRHTRHPV